jgi:anti-sigma regulatory factor (Ser/Thr protein kinase)
VTIVADHTDAGDESSAPAFDRRFLRELAPIPGMLSGVRRELAAFLRIHGCQTATVERLVLATHEVLVNAVEHSGTAAIMLHAQMSQPGVVIEIRDQGSWLERGHARADGGRGLNLVGQLVDSVDLDARPGGTCVTLRVDAP